MKPSNQPDKPQVAVALNYDLLTTPRVTAKGHGFTGEQIIRIAEENNVPLQENSALAEALSTIPLGEEIPRELYLAVAEVLAFVYLLDETQDSELP